jgi:exonuclease SbcC
MYTPERLQMTNFMSYSNETIEFEQETFIVHGENRYDRGQKTNGAGKSAPLEALVIIMTGRCLREGPTPVDFIKRGEEEMKLSFSMYNTILNTKIEIERTFYSKKSKSQKVSIKENGVNVPVTDPNHANNIVIEYLGIQKEDLLNYYLISKDKYKGFFSSGDAAKKDIISRFSNINLIDIIFENIDVQIKQIRDIYQTKVDAINREQGKLETYKEQLEKEEKRDLKTEIEDKVRSYNIDINNAKNSVVQYKQDLVRKDNEILKTEQAIDPVKKRVEDGDNFLLELEKLIESNRNSLNETNLTLTEISSKSIEAETLVRGKVNCPKCNFEFSTIDPSKDMSKVKEAIPVLQRLTVEHTQKVDVIQTQLNENLSKKSQGSLLKSQLDAQIKTLESQLVNLKGMKTSIDNNIIKMNQYIEGREALIKQVSANINENHIKNIDSFKNSIEVVENTMRELEKEKVQFSKDLDEKNDLKIQFLKFKSYLIKKTIKVIEFYTNKTLLKMGSSISVFIEGYTMKKDGTGISEKISTTVYREGIPAGIFGIFSSGERARIEVASILALQSLINSSSPSGGLNMLVLDEIIESIDSEGITGIVEELDRGFDKCIHIITHATYDGTYNRIMKAVKDELGESKMYYLNGAA